MSDGILDRFHGALVEALRKRDPEHLTRPFTVAEIYQDLVPYGVYRDFLGVEMNGDYEHALLRLLAGEGDFVELESEHALLEIREELESVNPNTGLYREFAAVDVRLNPARISDAAPVEVQGAAVEEGSDDWPTVTAETPSQDQDFIQVMPLGAFAAPEALDPQLIEPEPKPEPAPVSRSEHSPDVCLWCRETLPKRDNLNYCPFCGTDVKLVPCASCGEALEPEWRFCIACGARADGD